VLRKVCPSWSCRPLLFREGKRDYMPSLLRGQLSPFKAKRKKNEEKKNTKKRE